MYASSSNILATDDVAAEMMDIDTQLPDGVDINEPTLTKDEERALVRESTAGFAGECDHCSGRVSRIALTLIYRLGSLALSTRFGIVREST